MADLIRVNSSDLQQCISRYNSAYGTLRESYEAYVRSLKALSNDWTGRAFLIMSGKVASMGLNIAKSFQKLEDAVSELSEMNELVSDTENSVKQTISAQDEGSKSPFSV